MEERPTLTLPILRRRKRLSQLALATELGVTQTEISLIENGWNNTLRKDGLAKAAKILEVEDPDDLLLPYEDYLLKTRETKAS